MNNKTHTEAFKKLLLAGIVLFLAACSSLKTPATAEVAVSKAEVDNAVNAGAPELAPVEMAAAREKLTLANKALANKDYKLASELATQAQVDAKLAKSKANSTKAQIAADALQEDIRILRDELNRKNSQ